MSEVSRADPPIVRGRRRETSRHRSSRMFGLPGWAARTLRSGTPLVSLLPALIAVVLVQSLNPAAQRVPTGEGRFGVAGSWAASQPGAIVGYQHWTTTPVIGWLQLGALERALLGGTAQSVLAAVHGAMLLVTLAAVVLLWFVLRQTGASGLAAGAATAVFGIAPMAVVAHTSVVVADLAVVWLLAAALIVLTGHGSVAAVAAGATTGAAVLTAPLALVAVPVLAWVLLLPVLRPARGAEGEADPARPPWRPVLGAAAGFAVALLGAGVAALVLASRPGGAASATLNAIGAASAAQSAVPSAGAASAIAWLVVDPLSLLLGLIAVILVARTRSFLPVVALAVLVAVVSFWPAGRDPVGPIAMMLPAFAVATAAATDRAVTALGQPRFLTSLLGSGWLMGVAAMLVVSALVWATSLDELRPGAQQPIARADRWMRSSIPPGQLVLVDLATWPDLARGSKADVGWYAPADHAPAPSSAPWTKTDYLLTDGTGLGTSTGAAASTLARSLPVVRFGTGPSAVQVRAVRSAAAPGVPSTTTPTPAEKRAATMRRQTGAELAQNPRLTIDGADRALLTGGEVDSRVAVVLGQLLASHRVRVGGFPAVPGDPPGIRRQVLISAVDGEPVPHDTAATGLVLRYLSGLRGDFATSTIDATDAGVLATFAPDPTFVP